MKFKDLKEFIDSIGDMVIVVGKDRRIIAVNEVMLRKCGLKEADVVGKECHRISRCLKIPCPSGVACPLREVLTSGRVKRMVHTHYTRDGRKMVVEITASPLKENGETVGIIEIIRDVTAAYSLQENLKASLERFKKTVKIKELFTDILTHDLINVANIVLLQCETILDREKCEDTREDLKRLKRNVERLVVMIENAARYARLQSIDSLDFRRMDLHEVLKNVVSTLEESARERNITIDLRVHEPVLAMVNPNIESVFYNLISNAIKFSPRGERVVVDILDEGEEYLILVKDRGPGIPDEEKERIFERFKRVEKGAVKGTGLGLAIVKRIVELHGGRVWVEDNPGGGSIFYVRIPKEQR